MDIQTIVSDLRAERNRIDRAISALEGLTSSSSPRRGRPPKSKQAAVSGKTRRMSASARKRISEAMKKRWAKWHGKSAPKRKPMSPAARKRLSDMMKKRWTEKGQEGVLTSPDPSDAITRIPSR
jgi:hypothetical protein